jgi:hypothetical protein
MDVEHEAPAPAAIAKDVRQTLRDMVLFSVAAGLAFGLFWYGILTVLDLRLWRETQAGFAVAAMCSALCCAVVHKFLFFFVPVLETWHGGRVVYRPVAGTSVLKRLLFALFRDEVGDIIFLGLGESAIVALPAAGAKCCQCRARHRFVHSGLCALVCVDGMAEQDGLVYRGAWRHCRSGSACQAADCAQRRL